MLINQIQNKRLGIAAKRPFFLTIGSTLPPCLKPRFFSLDNRLRKSTSDFPQRRWVCQTAWPGGQRHLQLIWVEPDVCRRLTTNMGSLAFNLGPQHLLLANNPG